MWRWVHGPIVSCLTLFVERSGLRSALVSACRLLLLGSMNRRLVLLPFLLLAAVGCGSSAAESSSPPAGSPPPGSSPPAGQNDDDDDDDDDLDPAGSPPTRPEDVISVYDRMGNACNGGVITRTFAAFTEIDANNLWTAPDSDPAGVGSPKLASGWGNLVAPSKFIFEGLSDDVQTTSPEQAARCSTARDIFTPITRDKRSAFANVLLFAGEHPHLDGFPASGSSIEPVAAPVRLKGYIDVSSGLRNESGGVVTYDDVATQHLPIYVSCERPLRVARELRSVPKTETDGLDLSTCKLDGDEESYTCVFERVEHVADNRCTFVATDVLYRTTDGGRQRLSLGGRLESNGDAAIRYRVTVDRYAFHVDR
ncbi:MAG: hypothetical protein BGO98_26560 [Myxococcales bacterium 68-20]|nr:MAG: hypothetical protein BGO98_26560 [Myxococcales bacterium 68-20]